jgi:SARP family transcriptional regulator, regulator of embCAB operon
MIPQLSLASARQAAHHPRISLLGGFRLTTDGPAFVLPQGSKRLLALLALRATVMSRQTVAGILWPYSTKERAYASLRSALARLRGRTRTVVAATARELRLSDDVAVDLWESQTVAHRLLDPAPPPTPWNDPGPEAIPALSAELLPDWDEEWALVEAEEWRQLRLHALEALADRLRAQEMYGEAAAAALAAAFAEPLRESPRAALIRVHIAEGNPTEALREFASYRQLLVLELGIEPTERLRALVADPVAAIKTRDPRQARGGGRAFSSSG